MNRGWTLFCGAGVAYEPQLAKAFTPRGVVSTGEKSVFVLGLLELRGMEELLKRRWSPISSGESERPPPVCWSISSPGVPGSTSCTATQR